MERGYCAVVRAGGSDELTHWKYIKKVKTKNGKTRYIYDTSELKKYENGITETKTDKDGTETTTVYKDVNDVLSSESTLTNHYSFYGSGVNASGTTRKITKSRGKLDRVTDNAQAKAEKWIYDKFLKKKSTTNKAKKAVKKNTERTIEAGMNWYKKNVAVHFAKTVVRRNK